MTMKSTGLTLLGFCVGITVLNNVVIRSSALETTSLLGPLNNASLTSELNPGEIAEEEEFPIPAEDDHDYHVDSDLHGGRSQDHQRPMQTTRRQGPPLQHIPRWSPPPQGFMGHSNPLLYNDHMYSSLVAKVQLNLQLRQRFLKYDVKFQDTNAKIQKILEGMTATNAKIEKLIAETKQGFKSSNNGEIKRIGEVRAELRKVSGTVGQLITVVSNNKADVEQEVYDVRGEIQRVEHKANEQSSQIMSALKKTMQFATNPDGSGVQSDFLEEQSLHEVNV